VACAADCGVSCCFVGVLRRGLERDWEIPGVWEKIRDWELLDVRGSMEDWEVCVCGCDVEFEMLTACVCVCG